MQAHGASRASGFLDVGAIVFPWYDKELWDTRRLSREGRSRGHLQEGLSWNGKSHRKCVTRGEGVDPEVQTSASGLPVGGIIFARHFSCFTGKLEQYRYSIQTIVITPSSVDIRDFGWGTVCLEAKKVRCRSAFFLDVGGIILYRYDKGLSTGHLRFKKGKPSAGLFGIALLQDVVPIPTIVPR
jgi:hypothetical protein